MPKTRKNKKQKKKKVITHVDTKKCPVDLKLLDRYMTLHTIQTKHRGESL